MKKIIPAILFATVLLSACSNEKVTYYNQFATIVDGIQTSKNAFSKEASKGGQADSVVLKNSIDSLVPALTNAIKSLKALETPSDGKQIQQNAIAVDSMMLISVQAVGNALIGNLNDKDAAIFNAKMETNATEMQKLQAALDANLEKFRKDNGIVLESKK